MIDPKLDGSTCNETELLEPIQKDLYGYFLQETNRQNGLVLDKAADHWPCSIATGGWHCQRIRPRASDAGSQAIMRFNAGW